MNGPPLCFAAVHRRTKMTSTHVAINTELTRNTSGIPNLAPLSIVAIVVPPFTFLHFYRYILHYYFFLRLYLTELFYFFPPLLSTF